MYQNEEQVAFLRLDGGNRRMAPFDISRTINEQVRKHYQPIIDRMKAQIDDSLSKPGIHKPVLGWINCISDRDG